MRIVISVVAALALVAFGIFVDISWLLVGGIEQIVHACQVHPVDGTQMAWGVLRVVLSGIGTTLSIMGAILLVALGADWDNEAKNRKARQNRLQSRQNRTLR